MDCLKFNHLYERPAPITKTDGANRPAKPNSCLDHFLRAAQQLDVELAAREQHVVQRFADIGRFDCRAAVASDAACAMRRISSLMKAALTPLVRCAASRTRASPSGRPLP